MSALPMPAEPPAGAEEVEAALRQLDEAEQGTVVELSAAAHGWRIGDDNGAEWAARKLAAARARNAEAEKQRQVWADQLDTWLAEATRGARATAAFMEAQLGDYMLRIRAASGDEVKSWPLPSAMLSSRAKQPAAVILDPDVFVAWAEMAAPDLVRRDPKPAPISDVRQQVEVATQRNGVTWTARLDCGHAANWSLSDEDEGPKVGDVVTCREGDCYDALDGAKQRYVAEVEQTPTVRLLVLHQGEPVPGMDVSEGGVSYSVKLRGGDVDG